MSTVSHQDRLSAMRKEMVGKNYEQVLRIGRAELERGCSSSELLLLMATAGQLSEGDSCSLDDIRGWLEQATELSPGSAEAWIELGHFMDSVADEPERALLAFEKALERSLDLLKASLDGIESASPSQNEQSLERVDSLCREAARLLDTRQRS